MEIVSGSSFNSVDAVAKLHDVQVSFYNSAFRPERLQKNGKVSFEAFSNQSPVLPQEEILRGLLRQRAPAPYSLAVFVVVDGPLNRFPIEAMVMHEVLIFRRDHRKRHGRRHPVKGNP